MAMNEADVIAVVGDSLLPMWQNERERLDRIDAWARWDHDDPSRPKSGATTEYKELIARSQVPWGDLIVSSVAQTLYVEGFRRPDRPDDSQGWSIWQANGMDARQVPLHRSALTYGLSYGLALPGRLRDGTSMPTLRGVSPREMIAVYEDVAFDEWPTLAMRVRIGRRAGSSITTYYRIGVLDETTVYHLEADNIGDKPKLIGTEEHGAGSTPVVRYANRMDLEGRTWGEIEPVIPLIGKIDQTSFDRLVVQRFASWIVRTISGMNKPSGTSEADLEKLRLKVEDILISSNPETKFGSLPATPLNGFIEAYEADVRVLAAVTQSPAHEMLGSIANLSADALAAARASQSAKSDERKHAFGESHEQLLRLASHLAGDSEGSADFESQVQWKDTEIRSMAQAADALGKLVTMLGIPAEIAWEKIPGFTQLDIERAREILQRDDSLSNMLREMLNGSESDPTTQPAPEAPSAPVA